MAEWHNSSTRHLQGESQFAKTSNEKSKATTSSLCLNSLTKQENIKLTPLKALKAKLDNSALVKQPSEKTVTKPANKSAVRTAPEKQTFSYESDTDYFDDPPPLKPERLWYCWLDTWQEKAKSAEKTCVEFVKEIYGIPKIASFSDAKEICRHLPNPNQQINQSTLNRMIYTLEEGRRMLLYYDDRCGINELSRNLQSFYLPNKLVRICDEAQIPLSEYLAYAQTHTGTSQTSFKKLKNLVKHGDLSPQGLQAIAQQALVTADSIRQVRNDLIQLKHPIFEKYEKAEQFGTPMDIYDPPEVTALKHQKRLIEQYRQAHSMSSSIAEGVKKLVNDTASGTTNNAFTRDLREFETQVKAFMSCDLQSNVALEQQQNVSKDTLESLMQFRQGAGHLQKILSSINVESLRGISPTDQHKFFSDLQGKLFTEKKVFYRNQLFSINECCDQLVDQYNKVNTALNIKRTGYP